MLSEDIHMAKGELSQEQIDLISRSGIKKLIQKYAQSQGRDQQTLSMLLEQVSKTPLYLAVQKGSDIKRAKSVNFVTLTLGGQVFIPIFTDPDEFGKLKDGCDFVCMHPMEYFRMLVSNNRHAVINPFGSYFLMWPELVRDHMLPYMKESEEFKQSSQVQQL